MAERDHKSGKSAWDATVESINELFREALSEKNFERVNAVIDQVCALKRYALWNAFLITSQRPGAIAVASPREWLQVFGRRIIPGARPIVILHPYGPVRFVYELSDTYGPENDERLKWPDPFAVKETGKLKMTEKHLEQIADTVKKQHHILVQRDDYGTRLAGIAAPLHVGDSGCTVGSDQKQVAFVIRLAHRQTPARAFATLAHELGHIFCGHVGAPMLRITKDDKTRTKAPAWEDRREILTKAQREFEAEATAYICCHRLGMETRSAAYLSGYVNEDDWSNISVPTIVRAANWIEAALPGQIKNAVEQGSAVAIDTQSGFNGDFGKSHAFNL